MSYRDKKTTDNTVRLRPTGYDFASRLRDSLEKRIRHGIDGIDRAGYYEKKREPDIVFRNFSMSDEIFNLACKLNEAGYKFDHRQWVSWMTDAYIAQRPECAIIYQRSNFTCSHAMQQFGEILKIYFAKPVVFRVDEEIRRSVEAA